MRAAAGTLGADLLAVQIQLLTGNTSQMWVELGRTQTAAPPYNPGVLERCLLVFISNYLQHVPWEFRRQLAGEAQV